MNPKKNNSIYNIQPGTQNDIIPKLSANTENKNKKTNTKQKTSPAPFENSAHNSVNAPVHTSVQTAKADKAVRRTHNNVKHTAQNKREPVHPPKRISNSVRNKPMSAQKTQNTNANKSRPVKSNQYGRSKRYKQEKPDNSKKIKKIENKNTKNNTTKSNTKSKENIKNKSILDLLPVRKSVYYEKGNYHIGYLMKNKKYMNIFGVISQDYPNISEVEICTQASHFDMTYRIYDKSLKFIGLNMPVDTSANINYFDNKMKKVRKKAYREILKDNIRSFQNLDMQSKQSYAMIFADTYEELVEKNNIIMSHLCSQGLLRPLLVEEKENLLKKLSNPFY